VRRCLAAGCPERVCRECGKPSVREVERSVEGDGIVCPKDEAGHLARGATSFSSSRLHSQYYETRSATTGWTDCGHGAYRPGIVLDPFIGSGKTAQQARRMGLHAIGIDGSAQYLAIAARRLAQLSLLA
jgi:DNA methylase